MSISESLLPEYDLESANTRRVLKHVRDDLLDWKACESLNSIRWVASHLADIPNWIEVTLRNDSFDVAPPGGPPHQSPQFDTVAEIVQQFDQNIKTGREVIAATDDAAFMQPWSLLQGGNVLFTVPRIGVYRSFIMQMACYLAE